MPLTELPFGFPGRIFRSPMPFGPYDLHGEVYDRFVRNRLRSLSSWRVMKNVSTWSWNCTSLTSTMQVSYGAEPPLLRPCAIPPDTLHGPLPQEKPCVVP